MEHDELGSLCETPLPRAEYDDKDQLPSIFEALLVASASPPAHKEGTAHCKTALLSSEKEKID